ncbi:MAG: tRNA lysidine(34) synthetase TilS [Alphaproteobacteria bacterium]|jgi:tRNA(Ile)-lysidine synthase|nr:tRNA lysidine(34) synthetase TilS [Alphaproteobacteria bacterium]
MPAISDNTFAALMRPLGPYEAAPCLAVAVSGGADSMALALLAQSWTRRRGGEAAALTVDHGLRPEAAAEARQVHAWLSDRGMLHHTLRWRGPKPLGGIQAAARQARYEALGQWCRRHDVLHLLTAHHGGDQAETLLLRLWQGSGIEGLAGIPRIRALEGVRLVRPLLQQQHADLAATLTVRDQAWLEDPSNRDEKFARVRARRHLARNGGGSDQAAWLLEVADQAAVVRRRLGAALAELAARSVRLHPAGFCHFDPVPCRGQNQANLAPLLGDVLRCIGGGDFRPRREKLDRLARDLAERPLPAGRTLAGARLLPTAGGLLICRESGRLPGRVKVGANKRGRWDRFAWSLTGGSGGNNRWRGALSIGALGRDGWRQTRARLAGDCALPAPVRPGLPALWYRDRVLSVPHLDLMQDDDAPKWARKIRFSAGFSPARPLQAEGLMLV